MTIFGMQEQIFLSPSAFITFQSLLSATDTFFLFLFIRKVLVDNLNIHPIHELRQKSGSEFKLKEVNFLS